MNGSQPTSEQPSDTARRDGPEKVVTLVTSKTDAEMAAEFKAKIAEAYKPVLAVIDEILKAGFNVNIQTGPDAFGRHSITGLMITKTF